MLLVLLDDDHMVEDRDDDGTERVCEHTHNILNK